MKQLKKKKKSRVSKYRNPCNQAKTADHKEQMTLKQLSDAFGSVTMKEAASALTEPNSDPKMAVEILSKCVPPKLDQSSSSSGNNDVDLISNSTASKVAHVFTHKNKRRPKFKKVIDSAGSVSNFLGKDYVSSFRKKVFPKIWVHEDYVYNKYEGQWGYNNDKAPDGLLEMSACSTEESSVSSESASSEDSYGAVGKKRSSMEIFIARNKSIENVLSIDLRGLCDKEAIKRLKSYLRYGALGQSVKTFRFKTGLGRRHSAGGKPSLKTSVIYFLTEEEIQWTEEDEGTTLVIRINGKTNFSFLFENCIDYLMGIPPRPLFSS